MIIARAFDNGCSISSTCISSRSRTITQQPFVQVLWSFATAITYITKSTIDTAT
jgi:hypothetical protein